MMKRLAFILGVALSFYASCGIGLEKSSGSASISASRQNPQQRGKVKQTNEKPQKCEVSDIQACTMARGGPACFSRCKVEPSLKYCRMEPLNSCLNAKGGSSCYVNYCNPKVFTGPFSPPAGEGLIKIPEQGYGFETYGDADMRHGKPRTIARVQELALRVYNKTGYKIFVGNLSNSYGGNSGRHSGHIGGVEVDVAVMGNTPMGKCYNIWESCYLRSASLVLADEVRKMGGATLIYFNDTQLQSRFPGFVQQAYGHDDHYHIRWYLE